MDGDLGAKLKEVLNDPETMKKIRGIAASLGGGEGENIERESEEREENPERREPPAPALSFPAPKNDRARVNLLSALMPYLNPERREAAKALIRILRIWELTDLNAILGG